MHHRARVSHDVGPCMVTCTCLQSCVFAADFRGSLAGIMHLAPCSMLRTLNG